MTRLHATTEWIKHLPNKLTLSRIAVVPILLLIFPIGWKATNITCAMLFFLGAATDFVDGWLARRYDNVTPLGALLDPIADKILIGGSLVLLASSGAVPAFVAGLLICRDLAVNGLRLVALERGATIAVNEFGKWKTACLSLAIFCLFINEPMFGLALRTIGMTALWISLILAMYSAWTYGRAFLAQIPTQT